MAGFQHRLASIVNGVDIAGCFVSTPPMIDGGGPSAAKAGTAVVGLTRRTVDETVGSSVLLGSVPLNPLPAPADWTEAFEPAAQSLGAAREGLAEGLEPVTTSARRAARLFWRDLPLTE